MNRVFSKFWAPIVLGLCALSSASTVLAADALSLYVGAIKTLSLGTVTQVVVGNDAILSATVLDSGDVLLLPKGPGVTDLQVWTEGQRHTTFTIHVDARPIADRLAAVKAITSAYPDVEVKETQGNIVVSGYVAPEELNRFQQLMEQFEHTVSVVRARPTVGLHNLIAFDVKIIEIDKTYTRNLGIRWQDTAGGPAFGVSANIIPNNQFSVYTNNSEYTTQIQSMMATQNPGELHFDSYLGWNSIISSQLEMLQANGGARSLAEPQLSTLSGETAKFLAGGQLPISIVNALGQQSIVYKDYGIILEITPVADQKNNIRSKIHAEVSSIDASHTVANVPALLNRSADSTINARPGDTIAISGLLNVSDTRNIEKIPLLGDLPIVGALFRSKEFQRQRTELLMLVTPRIQFANEPIDPTIQKNLEDMKGLLGGSSHFDKQLLEN